MKGSGRGLIKLLSQQPPGDTKYTEDYMVRTLQIRRMHVTVITLKLIACQVMNRKCSF
jgi:hypothetical protein